MKKNKGLNWKKYVAVTVVFLTKTLLPVLMFLLILLAAILIVVLIGKLLII